MPFFQFMTMKCLVAVVYARLYGTFSRELSILENVPAETNGNKGSTRAQKIRQLLRAQQIQMQVDEHSQTFFTGMDVQSKHTGDDCSTKIDSATQHPYWSHLPLLQTDSSPRDHFVHSIYVQTQANIQQKPKYICLCYFSSNCIESVVAGSSPLTLLKTDLMIVVF